MKDFCVRFNGKEYKTAGKTNLGDLLLRCGFGFMVCGGHGKCGKCRVKVKGAVSPVTETELSLLSPDEIENGVRLACRTFILGDCEVTAEEKTAARIRTDGFSGSYELMPAFKKYGYVVDIGTTTVAARLYGADGRLISSESALNPQSSFGADVISRMEAALRGSSAELSALIRKKIVCMVASMCEKAGIAPGDVDGAVITGNTVMLHFLTGTDTEPLTHAPFIADRLFGEVVRASDIGLGFDGCDCDIYLPPCVSAFVGADITSAYTAISDDIGGRTSLLVDIGTNGEAVLYGDGELFACSTAAGPAFEGAGISCGMGGSDGAIDGVSVGEDGSLHARVIGGGTPSGICGSGIVDAAAALLSLGIIDETGYLENGPAVIMPPVCITQNDVRAIQLAKSAIHAGLRTLVHTAGLDVSDVETLYIAGGFGSYLNVANAAAIGLIPAELKDRVKVVGNAALSGASMLLLCRGLREKCGLIASGCRIAELTTDPYFTEEYMERMLF